MSILHFVKASDIKFDYCFLEVSRNEGDSPFMDIRISDDRELSFFIYTNQGEISLSPEEWGEINEKGQAFYKSEIENEDSFNNWTS
ncbi:hypothetical protein [Vibrio caribbeanicus]|uniref:hypothetical protein n=1 Tax=Vibrio caribbeanicus TaxID=701175 RepID=UPI0030DD1F6E